MTARIALAFPDATMAGAEAPAYNGWDINAVARPGCRRGLQPREDRDDGTNRACVPRRHDGGR